MITMSGSFVGVAILEACKGEWPVAFALMCIAYVLVFLHDATRG